jgi:hypothetical protein
MTRSPEAGQGEGDTEEHPHLLEPELALRWRLSMRTLQRWRRAGAGPAFLQLGRRVVYRLSDIERFERAHERTGEWS